MLKRISKKLPFDSRKTVYTTTAQTNFDYCSTLYLNATKEQIKSMQGMRNILRCDYMTPKKFMLSSLGWLSISQRIKFNALVMIFKTRNGMLPDYLRNELTYVQDVNDRNLRNSLDFRLPNHRNELTRNNIFYDGLKMFNSLPNYVKECNSLRKFKLECKKYVLENFPIS